MAKFRLRLVEVVILDCFGGSGTTAMVAEKLGRDAVHVDMVYFSLARQRTAQGLGV